MALPETGRSSSSGMPGGMPRVGADGGVLRLPGEGHQPKEDPSVKLGEASSNSATHLTAVRLPRGCWVLLL